MVTPVSEYARVGQVVEGVLALTGRELRVETVPPQRAYGRVSAEDVRATTDSPPFSTSHMDGFAIRSADTNRASERNPARLEVVGQVGVGRRPDIGVREGQAFRVSTGSFMPKGADAVVPLEETTARGTRVSIGHAVAAGSFVFSAGEDIKRGSVVLRKGARIRAQDVGLAMAMGTSAVRVYARPTIAFLATGSELTNVAAPAPGKTRNTHVPIFLLMARELGCDAIDLGIAKDKRGDILAKLRRGLRRADMVLTTGGTSVGALDLAEDVVKRLKPKVIHHGIRMDRGRVAGVAVVKNKPVVMMPGPIQGAVNAFILLALPLIQKLSGGGDEVVRVRARLTRHWEARRRFPNFTKVVYLRVFPTRGGTAAEPMLGETESMSLLAKSNAVTVVPEEVRSMEAGQEVEAMLLPGFSFSS
ncbi:MAG: molybdopterin molybdotransferase MoeA [Nitrososphaerales archaeon]|nr:molybdopterin molybdotransferase MoeA [Nitrososphaerales archaeon]